MNRNTIVLLGGGLVSGFFLWQRGAETQFDVPATVLAVEQRATAAPAETSPETSPELPAETWYITARADGLDLALAPQAVRPDLNAGDAICVTVARRPGSDDSYLLAPGTTKC